MYLCRVGPNGSVSPLLRLLIMIVACLCNNKRMYASLLPSPTKEKDKSAVPALF